VVAGVGRLLRGLHAAAATFVPPPGAAWRPWFGRDLGGSRPVFGHCGTGPWNIIARDARPAALVDVEFAGPVDAVWELAQAAWLNAQLQDDDIAERCGLPDAAARARQVKLILDGYGLARGERRGFVDKMITFAVHDARAEAVTHQVTPPLPAGPVPAAARSPGPSHGASAAPHGCWPTGPCSSAPSPDNQPRTRFPRRPASRSTTTVVPS